MVSPGAGIHWSGRERRRGGERIVEDMTSIVAALKKSGFPLQTRVELEIDVQATRGWRLLASEHPWRDPDGRDQFIDLIASCRSVVLVIECKKAEERALLFLRPISREPSDLVKDVTFWHIEQNQGAGKAFGSALRDEKLDPVSYRARFCVATDKSGQRLLEHEARSVVLASDAMVDQFPGAKLPSRSFVLPVIVTTSPLFTLCYQPIEISLESGTFTNLDTKNIEAIQWIRFHKTLTAAPGALPRTVFVVHSAALPTFLDEVGRQGSPDPWMSPA